MADPLFPIYKYGKCPKISNTLFYIFLPKFAFYAVIS